MAKTKLEKKIIEIHKALMEKTLEINDLNQFKTDFEAYYDYVMDMHHHGGRMVSDKALRAFLDTCNIVYLYSRDGHLIITDTEYDMLMEIYMSQGNDMITVTKYDFGDKQTKWDIVPHTNPDMVGSLLKSYREWDFAEILCKYASISGDAIIKIAPKYDGASLCINVRNGNIINTLTRKDGINGQNIHDLIKMAKNYDEICKLASRIRDGAIKCEILCSKDDYALIKDVYMNPRSAVNGIVQSPKNISYGQALTIMPLVIKDIGGAYKFLGTDKYLPPHKNTIKCVNNDYSTREEIVATITDCLERYRHPDYPFRVDGVVAYVIPSDYQLLKRVLSEDAMALSYAFKINSNTGVTDVVYGYMSIGRSGIATPMIKVNPVDVNETTVTDINLSNMRKAESFNLRMGDLVEIESSGDVIPMLKRVIEPNHKGQKIKFSMTCPHCGSPLKYRENDALASRLKSKSAFIVCPNSRCPRILAGKLALFAERIGIEGFSDEAFQDIYNATKYSTGQLMRINYELRDKFTEEMLKVPGWGTIKINNLIDQIDRVRKAPMTEDVFIASLGIPSIAAKKAQLILTQISLPRLFKKLETNRNFGAIDMILGADGIGPATTTKFIEYIIDNYDEIIDLYSILNIQEYSKRLGTFACTGFINSEKCEIEEELNRRGYGLDSLTMNTIALIAVDPNGESGKLKKARKYGIPIIRRRNLDKFLSELDV